MHKKCNLWWICKIFKDFNTVLCNCVHHLKSNNYRFLRLDGKTPAEEKSVRSRQLAEQGISTVLGIRAAACLPGEVFSTAEVCWEFWLWQKILSDYCRNFLCGIQRFSSADSLRIFKTMSDCKKIGYAIKNVLKIHIYMHTASFITIF